MDLGEFRPIAMIEADAILGVREGEGEGGFEVQRLYLGAAYRPAPWATVVASINLVAGEHESVIVDAFARAEWRAVDVSVGYSRTPLFASAIGGQVDTLPIPELSLPVRSIWPGRDAGIEAHPGASDLPIELWGRVGNGSGNARGNDNQGVSGDVRADLVLGRARVDSDRSLPTGLRVGAGFHAETAEDRPGITGTTMPGFQFWRAPTVQGAVVIGEAHLVVLGGPIQATIEATMAQEGRSEDTDGNPDTPREKLDPVQHAGGSAEICYTIGGHRQPGAWPAADQPAVEATARMPADSMGSRDLCHAVVFAPW